MFLAILAFVTASAPSFAQEKPAETVDTAALSLDLTRFLSVEGGSASAFWCPAEFFRASLRARPGLSAAEIEKSVEAFQRVQLFAVSASETREGQTSYFAAETLAHRLVLRAGSGKEILPLESAAVAPELRAFAASLRPGLASALGPSGKNMALVFFPGLDEKGAPLFSPTRNGRLTLALRDFPSSGKTPEFVWRLPLPSLLLEKTCPQCKELCRGDWRYCPWDGVKL